MYVPGADVARVIRSARKRWDGDLVVVTRWMKGCSAIMARC